MDLVLEIDINLTSGSTLQVSVRFIFGSSIDLWLFYIISAFELDQLHESNSINGIVRSTDTWGVARYSNDTQGVGRFLYLDYSCIYTWYVLTFILIPIRGPRSRGPDFMSATCCLWLVSNLVEAWQVAFGRCLRFGPWSSLRGSVVPRLAWC